jgi:hypothetical protein
MTPIRLNELLTVNGKKNEDNKDIMSSAERMRVKQEALISCLRLNEEEPSVSIIDRSNSALNNTSLNHNIQNTSQNLNIIDDSS